VFFSVLPWLKKLILSPLSWEERGNFYENLKKYKISSRCINESNNICSKYISDSAPLLFPREGAGG